jgi:hypothetical protein
MTYSELSKLPVGTIVIDDSDGELGKIQSGLFFSVIQWDNGCRTTLNTDSKSAGQDTPFRITH